MVWPFVFRDVGVPVGLLVVEAELSGPGVALVFPGFVSEGRKYDTGRVVEKPGGSVCGHKLVVLVFFGVRHFLLLLLGLLIRAEP